MTFIVAVFARITTVSRSRAVRRGTFLRFLRVDAIILHGNHVHPRCYSFTSSFSIILFLLSLSPSTLFSARARALIPYIPDALRTFLVTLIRPFFVAFISGLTSLSFSLLSFLPCNGGGSAAASSSIYLYSNQI